MPVLKSKRKILDEILEQEIRDPVKFLYACKAKGVFLDFSGRKLKSLSTIAEGLDVYTVFYQTCIQHGLTVRQGLKEAVTDFIEKRKGEDI